MMAWWRQTWVYWQSGGLLLIPIALVSAGIWMYFLRSRQVLTQTLREGRIVETALDKGDVTGNAATMQHALAQFHGSVADMLRRAVRDVLLGAQPLDAFNVRESEYMQILRRDFVVLAALTAIAPLLGLLGTVMGMIETFDAVSTVGGNTGGRVAAGISRALITTQFGLVVALPGVFGLNRLQRMLRNVQVLVGQCRSHAVQMLEEKNEFE
jgi:biopolymer transport protein ExbB